MLSIVTGGPGGQGWAATAAAAIASAAEVAARTVSAVGAVFELVHSGAGCTSGSGAFVKMRQHAGLAIRMRVATEMRGIELAMAAPRPGLARRLSTLWARPSP
jgi:hypothetical protein